MGTNTQGKDEEEFNGMTLCRWAIRESMDIQKDVD